jgi:beta-lactamase regulating signal transducer with metallopeptidase domain
MTPTWLEIAVAILLLWVAWRIALLLTPLVLKRFRGRRTSASGSPREMKNVTVVLPDPKNKNHEP